MDSLPDHAYAGHFSAAAVLDAKLWRGGLAGAPGASGDGRGSGSVLAARSDRIWSFVYVDAMSGVPRGPVGVGRC
jgi:hypothetical protein